MMDELSHIFSLLFLIETLLNSYQFAAGVTGLIPYEIYPDNFRGTSWNNFQDLNRELIEEGRTDLVFRGFVFMIIRFIGAYAFGMAVWDTIQCLKGQGSAAENRGGMSKAIAKNILIMIVSVLAWEANTVIQGTWEYLNRE